MTTTRRGFKGLKEFSATLMTATMIVGLGACSPALDWRESLAEGSGLVTSFPCRPDRHGRSVQVDDVVVHMEMLACPAADATYAVSYFDIADPARIGPTLVTLRGVMLANVQGTQPKLASIQIPGMTPNVQSLRLVVAGQRPEGGALQAQAVFFTKGLRVYQAAVIGSVLPDDAVDPFFAGLKFR